MYYPSSLVARLAVVAFAVTSANLARAQTPRAGMPPARLPLAPQAGVPGMTVASPTLRLVLWINGTGSILNGLTAATGPGGAPLPTAAEVRAQAQLRQPRRPPGILLIQMLDRSPAGEMISRLNACTPPACVIEIDRLGPGGQVVGSHRFSGGTITKQEDTNEVEWFQLVFNHITVTNVTGDSTVTDDWLGS